MGGLGSGRHCWHFNTRDTVDDYLKLDIRELKRYNMPFGVSQPLTWSRGGQKIASINVIRHNSRFTLDYKYRGEPVRYDVDLDYNRGGKLYFLCPKCGHRREVLYGGEVFICRKCRNLAYPSQNDNKRLRPYRRLYRRAGML